jgi:hypothetical protein
MPVTPLLNLCFCGDEGVDPVWPTAMLLLALAATVFEESISFLKNPVFLTLGVVRPPKPPALSLNVLRFSQPTADCAPCLESWLASYDMPVNGVCGLNSWPRVPVEVIGRLLRLPNLFRRARLPALVALIPPAEKTLWLVIDVAVDELVALL